jgi:hypothetical protein
MEDRVSIPNGAEDYSLFWVPVLCEYRARSYEYRAIA